MSVFTVEQLQKMNKNELITIIGNYISDQEIWLTQAKELEKQNNKKSAEIERLTEELEKMKDNRNGWRNRAWNDEKQNSELQKQVDELKQENLDIAKRIFNKIFTLHESQPVTTYSEIREVAKQFGVEVK